jgi:glycosyltransferase involved in cell wall biosynthesis
LRVFDEWQRKASSSALRANVSGNVSDSRTVRPLHLLTLTPFYPSDGDEVRGCFVAETLRQLELNGVTSSVIAVDTIYHARKQARPDAPSDWVRYPQLPGNFGLSSAGGFLGALLLNRVRKLHRESPIQVIHTHAALPCGRAAAFLSSRLGIPFVVTVHGLDVFNSCFEQGVAAGWRRNASLRVYKSASNVICVSKKVQQLLVDGAGSAVLSAVVYNGTDPDLFSPGSSAHGAATDPPLSILMVGNLLRGKGHELVLRAMERLKDSHPSLQCRMIGEGADQERFANLARDLGVGTQVHFLGRRSRSEVAAAMRDCTVFVLPSRFEGLGCVYLEAMSCGKPVIGCWGQGIDEIIAHGVNGWLIPVDGLEELVQGLQVLLADHERRRQIGEAARQTIVGKLTLSHQAKSLVEIYKEAAQ